MEESKDLRTRDLRYIFDVEWASLLEYKLDLKIMIVYDKETESYQCLYLENNETAKDLVETIKKRLKERKEQGVNNGQ